MSWECLFLIGVKSPSPSVRERDRKNALRLTMRRNLDMNRYMGKIRGENEKRQTDERHKLGKGGNNSSDSYKLRANGYELQVLAGEFVFSLGAKRTWKNGII